MKITQHEYEEIVMLKWPSLYTSGEHWEQVNILSDKHAHAGV